jgi:hypothetical protein
MIFNNIVERKLGLRFYDGGASQSSGQQTSAPQLSPQALLQMYQQALPVVANVGANNISGINQSLAQSAASANPVYTASGLQQLAGYAPGYTAAGAGVSDLNNLLNAGVLNSSGSALAQAGQNVINQSNPLQAADMAQSQNLVNSINLNGLSGGEQAAAERSLNQSNYATGNLGLDNATNAVSNAMNFGTQLQAKRTALANALGTANSVSGTQNSIFNPITTALSNPATSNFGLSQFNPTQANSTITSPLTYNSSIFQPLASNASSQKSSGTSNSSSFNFGL